MVEFASAAQAARGGGVAAAPAAAMAAECDKKYSKQARAGDATMMANLYTPQSTPFACRNAFGMALIWIIPYDPCIVSFFCESSGV